MTKAEEISRRFDDDGQKFEDASGIEIDGACYASCGHPTRSGDWARYEFGDGSAIITSVYGWDLGYSAPATCYCWAGNGEHLDGCEEGRGI